ncbi:MAG: TIGR03118 family protein [Luteolibacter sp.]
MKATLLPRLFPLASAVLLATPMASAQKLRTDAGYSQTVLVANKEGYHPQIVDEQMVDAWGIALRPPGAGGHIWIANAGTGTSSEFIGDVGAEPLHQDGLKTVKLDQPNWTDHGYAFVTGQVYNSASDLPGQPVEFPVSGPADNLKAVPAEPIKDGFSGSAKFIFVTEDGCINAWSSNTATAMKSAPVMVDYSKTAKYPHAANSVFTGVAMTNNPADSDAYKKSGGNHLFATDIRHNAIHVFDNRWKDVTDSFHFQTPKSVGTLHPFNIASLGGHLFVAYGEFDPNSDEGQEQIAGAGAGHIVEYNGDGTLVKDFFAGHGVLNLPWGMALAPASFGEYSGDLIVANFGDGTLAAFDLKTGDFDGYIRDEESKIISIDGLWGIAFGNGVSLGDSEALYYTAGPDSERDGVFGRINSLEPKSVVSGKSEPKTAPKTAKHAVPFHRGS